MDIGDVVSLNIDDVDRACIVLSKKPHFAVIELTYEENVNRFCLIRPNGNRVCRLFMSRHANEELLTMFYELLCGDRRIWMTVRDLDSIYEGLRL